MFCSKCGTKLDDNGNCPNCSIPHVEAEPVNKAPLKKGLSKGSRSYAALFTALLVFPASLSIAIDLSFHKFEGYWFGYVVGFLLVVWVCAVLPVMKITPPAITALICFTSIVGYTLYIVKKTGHLEYLFQRILPLFVIFALFIAIDVSLIGSKKLSGLHSLALISGEIGAYIICIEANYRGWDLSNLHWSPILACGFISVAAVLVAFNYVGRINKK